MHLPVEMIRQSPIVVQATQIRTTHVADLQLLMPAGARGIGQRFQLALFLLFAGFGGADFVELRVGGIDGAGFAEDADFEEAGVDGAREVGDLFELRVTRSPVSSPAGICREMVRQGGLPGRLSGGSRPGSFPGGAVRRRSSGCTRQCTFACLACSRIRSRTCSCPARFRTPF